MSDPIIKISNLTKVYQNGFKAVDNINLEVKKGEILALLGPNGAGKTTLISTICGVVNPSFGQVLVNGYDIIKDYRKTRSLIGLVPQELTTDVFEKVFENVSYSRGLFGKPKNDNYINQLLKDLSLYDKRNNQIRMLSGGMKRRVLIAKALSHEPEILFLDEPTAGVDVGLRKEMWKLIRDLQKTGVTIILTTHYIEEAEDMADRIGIINNSKLLLVEEKKKLMKELGKKELHIELDKKLEKLPDFLKKYDIELSKSETELVFQYNITKENKKITSLFDELKTNGIAFRDLSTNQTSLEDIFMNILKNR